MKSLKIFSTVWSEVLDKTKGAVMHTTQKVKFSIKVSSVNETKSAVACGSDHIY